MPTTDFKPAPRFPGPVRPLHLALLAAVLLPFTSSAQATEKIRSISVPPGWKGAAYSTDNGRFSHCVANASYKSDFVLFVSIDGDYYWKVGFLDRQKRLRNGRTIARIKIDGSRWSSFRTRVSKNNFFVLNMPGNSSFIRRFRRGRRQLVADSDVIEGITPFALRASKLRAGLFGSVSIASYATCR